MDFALTVGALIISPSITFSLTYAMVKNNSQSNSYLFYFNSVNVHVSNVQLTTYSIPKLI